MGDYNAEQDHDKEKEDMLIKGERSDEGRRTYVDMVAGSSKSRDYPNRLLREELELTDRDCIIGKTEEFPTIKFSERVHNLIDKNMQNSVIVRLLGRTIGFKDLETRIQSLRHPQGRFKLVDLENNYFIVRFEYEEDYLKVLTEGRWTIYDSYLTVQQWSNSFSTTEKHPSHVVVWIRLPRLPNRYHTKKFNMIASIIGSVVCLYKTTTRVREREEDSQD
ncbi:hypothetical protein F3Y22_tig00001644pilonHSYRG00459 [Hibiscus syriacus]|uniref:DUF4283 domain-containing protein n=1 Tax=Hibiscus syriacus TaxID=106335 RepID=A0A6A3D185_HIBSY|nr:hypothetical protein F3Y22_tig00001644pilonHSYRG00459 [Hibiscus syriacus]